MITLVCTDLEAGIRSVVADVLGVGADELAPEVSLTDDLAADSLDLAELAVALEVEVGVSVTQEALAAVRTYGDLLRAAHGAPAPIPVTIPAHIDADLEAAA